MSFSHASRFIAVFFVAFWGCGLGVAEPAPPEADLSLLFIGNSLTYSNDLPGMLERLLEDEGGIPDVHVESVSLPNFGLEDHWTGSSNARSRVQIGGWDYVIMQQGPSATEGRPSLLEYAGRFAEEVEAVGARPALYMVWPADSRSFDFDGVSDSYRTAAQQVGGLLFPAGEAWRAAWARDPSLRLYATDGFHPTARGTYLAALVMFEQLTGRDPAVLSLGIPTPNGPLPISAAEAAHFHAAARSANASFALP